MNKLFYGDNLNIMRGMPAQSVDLIYLDPPFNSKRSYNLLYKNMTGRPAPDQDIAFCDTWEMDEEKVELAKNMPVLMRDYGIEDYYVEFWRLWIQALRHTDEKLLAYLLYMVQRIMQMKVILKPAGSLYLHCDPNASHYIKVMLDGIFGYKNFINEIVWCYKTAGRSKKHFPKKHDTILWYGKSNKFLFNYDAVSVPRDFSTMHEPVFEDENGLKYQRNIKGGKEYRYYEDKGVLPNDYWVDIPAVNPAAKERLGYATQKPIGLMERIIKASSNSGDVVFDPFCGCGTTIYAAELNDRNWIGCDIAILAVQLVSQTLTDKYNLLDGKEFEVTGIPVTSEQAGVLFRKDPFEFERWVVQYLEGIPTKRTGDRGIDGRVYLRNGGYIVVSVKGGAIRPTDIRDLRGVLDREEDAKMGCFVSLKEPTKGMRQEAASAGMYHHFDNKYPKIQLLTVADLLEEKKEIKSSDKFRMRKGQLDLPF